MRGVEMISERPALPMTLVVTWQVADPAVVPVFVTVMATASPPGTELPALMVEVKGPIPRDELPAREARRRTAAPIPRKTVPWVWLADGCARPSGLQRSHSAVCSDTGAPQRTHACT
jgi:hypothetical protein